MRLARLSLVARSAALFVSALALLDVASGRVVSEDSLFSWWSSTHALLPWSRAALVSTLGMLLLGYALVPTLGRWRRRATLVALLGMVLRCLADSLAVLGLHLGGTVPTTRMLPLSLGWAVVSALILGSVWRSRSRQGQWRRRIRLRLLPQAPLMLGAAGFALLFAYGQMLWFGHSDYRRHADAVVVFGARVYRSGRPSLALADRVSTASELVRLGYAPVLIVSGGPGDGDVHEVEAMRELALSQGVPASAIIMDRDGTNTRATVRNTSAALGRKPGRILAVSHSYHLPRIKLSYQQQGIEAYTVPARETRTLLRLPWYMARESIAFWAHAFGMA